MDSSEASGNNNTAETSTADEEEENDDIVPVIIPNPQYPDHNCTFTHGPAEYNEDYYNGWVLVPPDGVDDGFVDGLPPFTGALSTTVIGVVPMDYFNALFCDTIWGEIAAQTNHYAAA